MARAASTAVGLPVKCRGVGREHTDVRFPPIHDNSGLGLLSTQSRLTLSVSGVGPVAVRFRSVKAQFAALLLT